MSDDDRDLRNRFARLRSEDRSHVPPFHPPVAGNASRSRWPIGIAIAAAIALVALVLTQRDPRPLVPVDLSVAAWRSPTDFLLDTPGRDMLRRVPVLGSPDEWFPPDLRTRAPKPESTRFQRTPS
jgi:hypothetical protein